MASSPNKEIPEFQQVVKSLTIPEAIKYRNLLLKEMDNIAMSAVHFTDKSTTFDDMRAKFKILQKLKISHSSNNKQLMHDIVCFT